MNVLVITGCCLKENTSANLCHRSYINGFLKLGHTVDLVSFSENGIVIDESIVLPKVRKHYVFNGVSLYERLAGKKANKTPNSSISEDFIEKTSDVVSLKSKIFSLAKTAFRKSYGIYNPSIVWFRNGKKLKIDEKYDLVVSLSYPQVSHLLTAYLINKERIKTKRWIQLWEDPWTTDLGNRDNYNKCLKAESKLLSTCKEIIYVSPITLKIQQDLFSKSKQNMKWFPLPSYYETELLDYNFPRNHYGYFGDYSSGIRNLVPFYNVAVEMGVVTYICGSSNKPFTSEANVSVYPRMPLDELKKYEDNTNVLICLFNLKGGQIPGKIYQYASTNKIVLVILDGTDEEKKVLKDYFSKYNRFIFCNNDEESIKSAISNIENHNLYGVSSEPLTCFSPQSIVKQIIESNDEK